MAIGEPIILDPPAATGVADLPVTSATAVSRNAIASKYWFPLIPFVAVLAVCCLVNQPYYPAPYLDEGFVLNGALNLVQNGQYAMRSSEGFRVLDQPLIANGPGVVLPIAAAFWAFGVGFVQARSVIAAFALIALVLYFALGRRLFGTQSVVVATFLLFGIPEQGFIQYSREALGNIPALAYFLAGALFWTAIFRRPTTKAAIGAGLFFGLAMITKGQYLLLLPVLVLTAALNVYLQRSIGLRLPILVLVTSGLVVAAWYAAQFILVGGWQNFGEHLAAVQSSSTVTVTAFRPTRILGTIAYLLRSGAPVLVIPGILYLFWLTIVKRAACPELVLFVVFCVCWLTWFTFVSVGWPRYAFDPYVVGFLLTAKAATDGVAWARAKLSAPVRTNAETRLAALMILGLAMTAAVWVGIGTGSRVSAPFTSTDHSAARFEKYLESAVEPGVIVESWEWELDPLNTSINFHHPTNKWVDDMTAVLQFQAAPPHAYDIHAHAAQYLVDGPFSTWTRLYEPSLASGCCTLIQSVGPYTLYRVKPPH